MGENTTRASANTTAAPKGVMKDARSVLTREVMQPLMNAIAPLAVAAEAATDPDQIRQIARRRADQLEDRAKQRGQELLKAARLEAKRLRTEAAHQGRELLAHAERDVQSVFEQREAAYQAALDAGWTVTLLQEVATSHGLRGGLVGDAEHQPTMLRVATSDTAESAEPTELPANAPT